MARRSKSQELLDFEIHFYEKLLAAYPDFVDVLGPLGQAYTRRGLVEKGLQVDLRMVQLRSNDTIAWYNLACSYSLLKRLDEALEALQRAVELGYSDLPHLQSDPDLLNLRQFPKYQKVLALVASRAMPKVPQAGGESA